MGRDRWESASHLAEFLRTLRSRGFIIDYGDVAILLHSVKQRYSRPYLGALRDAGIPVRLASVRHGSDGEADAPVDRDQRRDQALLTTIHQAKGRE